MALLPDTSMTAEGTTLSVSVTTARANKTYRMDIDAERIRGTITENLEAVRQAVYKILNTERYRFIIYSWNYGVELADLFGKPIPYVLPEIPRRITEALTQDDRIESVTDFDLSYTKRGAVLAKFTVHSVYGDIDAEKEVSVGV